MRLPALVHATFCFFLTLTDAPSRVQVMSCKLGEYLIGMAGLTFLSSYLRIESSMTLDVYKTFYVNKFVDHHAHEIVF